MAAAPLHGGALAVCSWQPAVVAQQRRHAAGTQVGAAQGNVAACRPWPKAGTRGQVECPAAAAGALIVVVVRHGRALLSCLWVPCSLLASSSSTASCSRSEPALSTDGEAQRWLRRRLPLPPLPPHSSLLTSSSSSSTPTAMGLSPPPPEGVQLQEQHQQQQQRQGQGRQHKGQQRLLQT